MTTFAQVRDGLVLSHFTKDCTLAEARKLFPDIAHELEEAPREVQDGWQFVNGVFAPRQPTAEEQRHNEFENALSGDATLAQLKLMTNAEYDAWYDANTTTLAAVRILLKRVIKLVIRRLL